MGINIRPIPNGKIATGGIKDPTLRRIVMMQNQNIASLKTQLEELQNEFLKSERKKV